MNKRLIALILSVAIAALIMGGCSGNEAEEATEISGTNVTVADVLLKDIFETVTYTGELMSSDEASVTSKVSAKILAVNAEIGDWVESGQLLLTLDSSDYEYQLKQAQTSYNQAAASYNQAEAGYKQAETILAQADVAVSNAQIGYENVINGSNAQNAAQVQQALSQAQIAYNNAKTNFERQEQLYNMGAISLAAYESAQTALENAKIALDSAQTTYDLTMNVISPGSEASAQNNIDSAEATKKSAQASLDSAMASMSTARAAMEAAQLSISQARDNIANTKIKAPISGYISAKNVTLGQFAAAGSPLFEINAAKELEVEIQVTESVIPYVQVGGEAVVSVGSSDIKNIPAVVTLVNPVKNSMGMYTVRVSVPNDDSRLKIGMFADIMLITSESAENAVAVPVGAILQEDGGFYVYAVNGAAAVKTFVTTGVSDGEYTQVLSGLSAGEQVVVDGKEYISEINNEINIVN
ncbi:MAG: efflux RND transporter periplasmic adaptor subunit [Clostridia bacterium]|nr:efflux RND transporter periplasmic adaptor subunit [Clostridia bacterium]